MQAEQGVAWSGYLTKKGGGKSFFGRSNWQRRFYTLFDDGMLRYYASESSKSPKGDMVVKTVFVPPADSVPVGKPNYFELRVMKQSEGKTIEFCANSQDQMFEFVTAVNRILSKQAVMQRQHRSSAESESPKDTLPQSQPASTRSSGMPVALELAAVTSSTGTRVTLTDPFADSVVDPLARRQVLQKLSPKNKDVQSPLRTAATLPPPPPAPLDDSGFTDNSGVTNDRGLDDSYVSHDHQDHEAKRDDTSHAVVTQALSSRDLTEATDTDTAGDGVTGDRTEYTGPTGTGTDFPSRDGTPYTSYEEQPLFNLDIRLKNGSQVMIPFYEGTDPEELAQAFAQQYDLSSVAASKLHGVILANLAKVTEMKSAAASQASTPAPIPRTVSPSVSNGTSAVSSPSRPLAGLTTYPPNDDGDRKSVTSQRSSASNIRFSREHKVAEPVVAPPDPPQKKEIEAAPPAVPEDPTSPVPQKSRFYVPTPEKQAFAEQQQRPVLVESRNQRRSSSSSGKGPLVKPALTKTMSKASNTRGRSPHSRLEQPSVASYFSDGVTPHYAMPTETARAKSRSRADNRGGDRSTSPNFPRSKSRTRMPPRASDRATLVSSPPKDRPHVEAMQSPSTHRPQWRPTGGGKTKAQVFSNPAPDRSADPLPEPDAVAGWEDEPGTPQFVKPTASFRAKSAGRSRKPREHSSGRSIAADARSVASGSTFGATLGRRSASRGTMRSRPDSNLDSEEEERKKTDWGSQTASLGTTQARPQSVARSRRAVAPPIVHAAQQQRKHKPVTHTFFPGPSAPIKTAAVPSAVPVNPKYSHVKSRVYQPVEPRGRQMVTQYQVVVGSDEPVVKVRTESSPNGRRVGAAHATGRSQSRSRLHRDSSDSVKEDLTQLAPDQLARELRLAREAQARFAELARVEAERRKQSEEALSRLQNEMSRSSLGGSSVGSTAVMEDLQATVNKIRENLTPRSSSVPELSPTTLALQERLAADRRTQQAFESELNTLKSTIATVTAKSPSPIPMKATNPTTGKSILNWGGDSSMLDTTQESMDGLNLTVSDDDSDDDSLSARQPVAGAKLHQSNPQQKPQSNVEDGYSDGEVGDDDDLFDDEDDVDLPTAAVSSRKSDQKPSVPQQKQDIRATGGGSGPLSWASMMNYRDSDESSSDDGDD